MVYQIDFVWNKAWEHILSNGMQFFLVGLFQINGAIWLESMKYNSTLLKTQHFLPWGFQRMHRYSLGIHVHVSLDFIQSLFLLYRDFEKDIATKLE